MFPRFVRRLLGSRLIRISSPSLVNPDTKYDVFFGCHKSQESEDY
jgi:hypothetical protein